MRLVVSWRTSILIFPTAIIVTVTTGWAVSTVTSGTESSSWPVGPDGLFVGGGDDLSGKV